MNTSAPPTFAHPQIYQEHHTPSPTQHLYYKIQETNSVIKEAGQMAIEVLVHLVIYSAAITTATQGFLWADPALPVEGPDPNPRVQLCSPPHRISGIQQQLPTALADGHLSYTTSISPKHRNKTGGICLLAKPTQEVPN